MRMCLSIFAVLLVLIGAVLIVVGIYRHFYKKRINRALEEGISTAHNRMAEPAQVSIGLVFVLCIIGYIVLLANIIEMRTRVTELEQNLSNRSLYLNGQIEEMQRNLTELIQQTNSEMISYSMVPLGCDTKKLTAVYQVEVTPKVITENMTVKLSVGEFQSALVQDGTAFRGTIEVPLFEETEVPVVSFSRNGETVSEEFQEGMTWYGWRNVLPIIECVSMTMLENDKKDERVIELEQYFNLLNEPMIKDSIVSGEITVYVDDQQTLSKDVSGELAGMFKEYESTDRITFSKDSKKVEIFLTYTDELGFTYRMSAYCRTYSEEEIHESVGGRMLSIQNADGQLVYSEE